MQNVRLGLEVHIPFVGYGTWCKVDALTNTPYIIRLHSLPRPIIVFRRFPTTAVQSNVQRVASVRFLSFGNGVVFHRLASIGYHSIKGWKEISPDQYRPSNRQRRKCE